MSVPVTPEPRELRLMREVNRSECPWLPRDLRAGEVVYQFDGCTYGCVSPWGMAVSFVPGENPFYEVPANAVEAVPVTPEPPEARLVEVIREARVEWYRLRENAHKPLVDEFIAERLASRVVWRDNLAQAGALTDDGVLVDMDELAQYGHCYADLVPVWRLVG